MKRPSPRSRTGTRLRVERLEGREVPAIVAFETFDQVATGGLPAGWQTAGGGDFAVAIANAVSGPRVLAATGGLTARGAIAAPAETFAADQVASIWTYAQGATPAGVFVRGRNLASAPSYYAATVVRGEGVSLYRVTSGQTSLLASVAADVREPAWLNVRLAAEGDRLRVSVYRLDTGEYLTPAARWQATSATAIDRRDATIGGPGRAGVTRFAGLDDLIKLDNFQVETGTPPPPPAPSPDTTAPAVALTAPAAGATLAGTVAVRANASDAGGVARVEFYVNSTLRSTDALAPYTWDFDTRSVADGNYTLTAKAFDAAGNVATATRPVIVRNTNSIPPATFPQPVIPRHYDHIRVAMLAWSGTPFTAFEQNLLRNSVDVVMPNEAYLTQIAAVAPNTPQLLYTNVSNIYQNLLADWLTYADRTGRDRENAFYHVPTATPFQGGSAGAQPVNWLWDVRRESTNLTSQARSTVTSGDVTFGQAGQSLYMGYTDRIRELNIDIQQAAGAAWSGVWEYPTAVDTDGNPTAWATLNLSSDGTNGLRQSGRVTFDPPANWTTASVGAGQRYYYVRVRTITGGLNVPPVARWILGRDFVNATYVGQAGFGTIPAFDAAADSNSDGYLSDAEYANRAAGKDARFEYESRLFYPYYGQMRYASNPAGAGFKEWAADFNDRILNANPLAAGIHIDNSNGKPPAIAIPTIESQANYTANYTDALVTIGQRIAPKWMSANTVGGNNAATDPVVRSVQAHFEEFTIRPLQHNLSAFDDLLAQVRRRQSLTNPPAYTILDSLLTSNTAGIGGPTDPRALVGALAYYYLLGNPDTTFFMLSGGNEPSSSWTRHWTDAIHYNVGRPTGETTVFASGNDPANAALPYRVYGRRYANALTLFKPLSYKLGVGTGTLADNTATTHPLDGTYRPLRADGTLGPATTSVTLRNGEGAVLIRV